MHPSHTKTAFLKFLPLQETDKKSILKASKSTLHSKRLFNTIFLDFCFQKLIFGLQLGAPKVSHELGFALWKPSVCSKRRLGGSKGPRCLQTGLQGRFWEVSGRKFDDFGYDLSRFSNRRTIIFVLRMRRMFFLILLYCVFMLVCISDDGYYYFCYPDHVQLQSMHLSSTKLWPELVSMKAQLFVCTRC